MNGKSTARQDALRVFSPIDKPRLFYSATILLAVCTLFWHMPASAALNDSGQIACSNGSTVSETYCKESIIGDNGEYPRQDARFGRDAQATDKKLGKNGGGHGGFDFTKICNNGDDCTVETTPGTGDTDWGCTRDNVTGLLWEIKMSDNNSPRHFEHTFTWYDGYSGSPGEPGSCSDTLDNANCNTKEYVEYINGITLCGANNWRLPTRRELLSIVNINQSPPLIDAEYFPNTEENNYWASEIYSPSGDSAWLIDFKDLASSLNIDLSLGATESIRLVSGTMPASNLQDNGDGTVSDDATGLMWDQCAIGQHWQHSTSGYGNCTASAEEFTWQQALEKVVELNDENHRGYNDWRLPNIKELESLTVLVRGKRPAFDEGFFPQTPLDYFWSASVTTNQVTSYPIKVVDFYDGRISAYSFFDDAYVRLVRGGQAFDRLTVNEVTLSAVADSPTSAVLTITVDRDATGYWLVRPAGNLKPKVNELEAGSSGSLTANAATFNLTGLVASTAYDVWFTAKVDSNYSLIRHTTFVTPATPPPQVKAFNDGDTLHYGILYFAPAGAPGFCLGDDLIDVSVQVTIDSVTYRITPRLNNTCLQVFPTGIGSQRALIIERGTADITTSAGGTPLLLTRSGDLVTADNPGAIIRATVDPLCTSTRITPLLGLISAPAWIVTPPPQTGCPADAITPPQAGYILNDGTLACDPAALTLKGTYAQFTIRWTQMLDAGQNFYVAAAVPGIAWFEDSVQNGEGPYWRVLQNFDPYAVVTTEGPLSASLFEGVDMRYLTGSEIYVGYGQDLVDMFSNRRYCAIIKVAPPAH